VSLRLEARHLGKVYGDCVAVKDVSLSFEPGKIHAVLGENGAGKSTFMKLLFGLVEPTTGEILLDGEKMYWRSSLDAIRHGLGMVQQHFTLVEPLSVIDNIMLGAEVCDGVGRLNRREAIRRLEGLLPTRALSLPWNDSVSSLSVGQKQKLEILKLLFRESKILFLDEPTAVLAPGEIDEFFSILKMLKSQGKTILLITHKINEVLSVCDTYSILRHGEVKAVGAVAGAKVEDIVEKMIGHKLHEISHERKAVSDRAALRLDSVSSGNGRLKEVSLQVRSGEIVGIAGVEGSGQSQLVESILGLEEYAGHVTIANEGVAWGETKRIRGLGVGLVPEDRHAQGLWMEESCTVNLALGLDHKFFVNQILREGERAQQTSGWAKQFDVRASSLNVPVQALSGGNQQKIIFAREVEGRQPRLLICHQPTRGVDLGAIDLIHRRLMDLRDQGVGILVISSELDELMTLSDRICVLFEGRIALEQVRAKFSRQDIGRAMTGVNHAH